MDDSKIITVLATLMAAAALVGGLVLGYVAHSPSAPVNNTTPQAAMLIAANAVDVTMLGSYSSSVVPAGVKTYWSSFDGTKYAVPVSLYGQTYLVCMSTTPTTNSDAVTGFIACPSANSIVGNWSSGSF